MAPRYHFRKNQSSCGVEHPHGPFENGSKTIQLAMKDCVCTVWYLRAVRIFAAVSAVGPSLQVRYSAIHSQEKSAPPSESPPVSLKIETGKSSQSKVKIGSNLNPSILNI